VRQDGNPDILHHKVFIIDNETVVIGSFNFSASARDNNNENLLIINNPDIANAFTQEWQELYSLGRDIPDEDLSC
jgi:phosphatidylserine/phosphatidylglycerophosphate/cardiolipin synthase-like enzyme